MLVPCVVPKFDPVIATDVAIPPNTGYTEVTNGEVPTVTDTLSNVAVARLELFWLLTASPTYELKPS